MKKVVVLLLLMVSTTVLAEWNKVGQSANGVFYVDIQSIKKKGKKAKIWILSDYKSVHEYNGKRHLSSVERDEFDCSEDKFRVTDLSLYSENMKGGFIVSSEYNLKESSISVEPLTINDDILKIACGKK